MSRRTSTFRYLALLGIIAVLAVLTGCVADVPLEYPLVNNATCWTQTETYTNLEEVCDPEETQWTDTGDAWVWRHCSSTGTTLSEYKYDSADCRTFKPTLLNKGHGDNYAHIYFAQDATGYPAISIWCVNEGHGIEVLAVREPDLALFSGEQYENGLISFYYGEPCAAPIEVYTLTTGEYQVNIGPDGEGKISSMVFSDLPPTDITFTNDDVDGTPIPPE